MREDALKNLKDAIEVDAMNCGFEILLLDGLLKFKPTGEYNSAYNRVWLELEQPDISNHTTIYKHRNSSLTSAFKGKPVSKKWVVNFLKHNANEVKRLKSLESEQNKHPKTSTLTRKTREEEKYGYSSGKSICSNCNGDGGAKGQCYKCDGSGWA